MKKLRKLITCKEDMRGCYVPRSDKAVFDAFMDKCEEFGVVWSSGDKPREVHGGVFVIYGGVECDALTYFDDVHCCESRYKRLTLSEFYYTLEEFFAAGYKLVDGDEVLSVDGVNYYVISAKALSEPQATIEYAKVKYHQLWELVKDLEEDKNLYYIGSDYPTYSKLDFDRLPSIIKTVPPISAYRRIETPITAREEFIYAICGDDEGLTVDDNYLTKEEVGILFDTGRVKLVDGGDAQLNQTINNYAAADGYEVKTRGDGVTVPQVIEIVKAQMGN